METAHGVKSRYSNSHFLAPHIEEFSRNGYTLFPKHISETLMCKLDASYTALGKLDQEMRNNFGFESSFDSQIIRCPLGYSVDFLDLALDRTVLEFIKQVLGQSFVLTMQNVVTLNPRTTNDQSKWHRDLNYQHFISSTPLALNFLVMMDEFTEENGATNVLPGSHLFEDFPSEFYVNKYKKVLTGSRGSVIIMNAMLYHRGGVTNNSKMPRRGVNHVVGLPFVGQQINIPKVIKPSVVSRIPNDQFIRSYLGYKWNPADSVSEWRNVRHG